MPVSRLLRGGARAELAGGHAYSKRARTHMANNPKKVKDPTEVALSAIQEALNISDANADNGRDGVRSTEQDERDDMQPPVPPAMPSFDAVFETREQRQPRMDTPAF